MRPAEQFVVIYTGADGDDRVYTTVYDEHESVRQQARCRYQHGIGCNARTVPAATAWRTIGRRV